MDFLSSSRETAAPLQRSFIIALALSEHCGRAKTFVSADSSQSATTTTEDAFFSEKERGKRRCLEFRLPLSFVRADHCSSQSNEGESAFSIITLTDDSGRLEFSLARLSSNSYQEGRCVRLPSGLTALSVVQE